MFHTKPPAAEAAAAARAVLVPVRPWADWYTAANRESTRDKIFDQLRRVRHGDLPPLPSRRAHRRQGNLAVDEHTYTLAGTASRSRCWSVVLQKHELPATTPGTHPSIRRMRLVTAWMAGSEVNDHYRDCALRLYADCAIDLIVWVDTANLSRLLELRRRPRAGLTLIVVDHVYDLPLVRALGGWEWARRQGRLSRLAAVFWARVHGGSPVHADFSQVSPASWATWISKPSMLAAAEGAPDCGLAPDPR